MAVRPMVYETDAILDNGYVGLPTLFIKKLIIIVYKNVIQRRGWGQGEK
jgi:hypothetical protein